MPHTAVWRAASSQHLNSPAALGYGFGPNSLEHPDRNCKFTLEVRPVFELFRILPEGDGDAFAESDQRFPLVLERLGRGPFVPQN
jgi:hypothetical protein